MDIKILGPGCAKCHTLDKLVREVVAEMKVDATVEYIKDIVKILDYPILTTPGLVINGDVKCSGRVPGKAEVANMIKAALARESE